MKIKWVRADIDAQRSKKKSLCVYSTGDPRVSAAFQEHEAYHIRPENNPKPHSSKNSFETIRHMVP